MAYLDFLEEGLCFLILLEVFSHRHQYLVDCPAEGRLQVTCSSHPLSSCDLQHQVAGPRLTWMQGPTAIVILEIINASVRPAEWNGRSC